MIIGIGFLEFDERRVAPPLVLKFLPVLTAARLRVAARLLLRLSLTILVLVLVMPGLTLPRLTLPRLTLPRLTLPRLALPGLTLPRLTLALASLLHGAHRVAPFFPAASAGPGSPPPRDAGSRSTSLAQRDGDGLFPLPHLASRARAEGSVLVLAHHLADLAATLRGPPAGSPCCALPGH
jgi:hypothetical protein